MSWKTWSPFQSTDVRLICDHMTEAERNHLAKRSWLYGAWVAISFAMPVGFLITSPSRLTIAIAVPFIILHLIGVPIWQKKQKEFLSSTEWAKTQGYTPDKLRLLRYRRR